MAKLQSITQIEKLHQQEILAKPAKADLDKTLKYFCTFPYPYMNGSLHLGHSFTMMGPELQSRYRQAKGINVLFPFGFHGSGMPIVAASKKLAIELEKYDFVKMLENDEQLSENNKQVKDFLTQLPKTSQIKILIEMRVNPRNISNFTDPTYWVPYFSEIAKQDLKDFHINVDLTRSFYTTNTNPYYDSFIRWQFSYLIERGFVYRGKRNTIFSLVDNQSCADHDRQIGEGVKPIETIVKFAETELGTLLVTICEIDENAEQKIIIVGDKFIKFTMNDKLHITNEWSHKNISHQYETTCPVEITKGDLEDVCKKHGITFISKSIKFGTGIYLTSPNKQIERSTKSDVQSDFCYEEPEELVTSRQGDICIVAKTDQWMINYGDLKLQDPVFNYVVNHMKFQNESVKKMFESAVKWLNEWPCSRNFGLGTFIPNTNDLIDSLSDSTIYMAYYTISHLVIQLPIEILTNQLWDYVFFGISDPVYKQSEHIEIINEMRKEFNYWYPLDLRVSGKDLISNHLSMALLNHQAIWQDSLYFPREYFVNGYLMLNVEKMSKSTGNFLTMREAIEQFGANATRFALVNSFSDGTDDGNFNTKYATSVIMKLYTELEVAKEFSLNCGSNITFEPSLWDKVFECEIYENFRLAEAGYEKSKYKNITYAFDALLESRNNYIKACKDFNNVNRQTLVMKFYEVLVTIIDPVCPTWAKEIITILQIVNRDFKINWSTFSSTQLIDIKCKYLKDVLYETYSDCSKIISKKKSKDNDIKLQIKVFTRYGDEEQEIIKNYGMFDAYITTIPKEKYGIYKGFYAHVRKNVERYGLGWLKWVIDDNAEEFSIIQNYLSCIIKCDCEVITIEPNEKSKFKVGPGSPIVSIIK